MDAYQEPSNDSYSMLEGIFGPSIQICFMLHVPTVVPGGMHDVGMTQALRLPAVPSEKQFLGPKTYQEVVGCLKVTAFKI